ncbi:CPBP family intramembrane glutamic endopeptidase [Paenibacillus xylaniclasticus]|uniref:CPBP family intramembrane glutamic endopeptidase n=1 Tax=Paenibacillus xylaniclasticus TaxID=588083 RepID=UPI000FDCD3E4|nr:MULTISPECIES: type II CAAX endopeptidase family protein [Paenibacillus]GFN32944.1 CAAX amino protease [Paenibacillus curdlanolyticus]
MTNRFARHEAQQTNGSKSTWSRIWRFPLVWMIVGLLSILVVNDLFYLLIEPAEGIASLLLYVVLCLIVIAIYKLTMKYLARQSTPELSIARAGKEAGLGALIAIGLIGAATLIITAAGGYSFQWADADIDVVIISAIGASLGASIVEELVFRGLALQAISKLAGNWAALAVTSLFFGVAHLGNPGATLWGGIAIAIEAGILLGAAFMWRKNLWFAMGLHFAWDFVDCLLDFPVSGHDVGGLFTKNLKGDILLTGGEFGLEASFITVILGLLIAIPMLISAARKRASQSPKQIG